MWHFKLRTMARIGALACLSAALSPMTVRAENAQFSLLRTVSIEELNTILDRERGDFLKDDKAGPDYKLPSASKASNAVDIYRVSYETTIPERNNERVNVSGLLAIPKLSHRSQIPLMAYQHGTVYDRYAVPSYAFKTSSPSAYDHRPESYEDRYMVALFGGNGYAVMSADYVGMGDDTKHHEAYLIKGVSAQASLDLYHEVKRFLARQKIQPSNVFLGGWSQGGINTTGFLAKLESNRIPVKAAFTAAAPNDPLAALNAVMFHPLKTDSPFFGPMIGQLAFSCETYGGPKGLAKASLNPHYYTSLKSVYERSYGKPEGDPNTLRQIMLSQQNTANLDYINDSLRNPAVLAQSDFGRCLARNETYRQEFKTDLRMYYGSVDPIIRPRIGRLAYDYNLALNATPEARAQISVTAIPVPGGTHRLTFITASVDAKAWMDSLR